MQTVNQFEATYRIPREFSRFRQAIIHAEDAKTFQGHADSLAIGTIIIVIAWFMGMAVDLREEK